MLRPKAEETFRQKIALQISWLDHAWEEEGGGGVVLRFSGIPIHPFGGGGNRGAKQRCRGTPPALACTSMGRILKAGACTSMGAAFPFDGGGWAFRPERSPGARPAQHCSLTDSEVTVQHNWGPVPMEQGKHEEHTAHAPKSYGQDQWQKFRPHPPANGDESSCRPGPRAPVRPRQSAARALAPVVTAPARTCGAFLGGVRRHAVQRPGHVDEPNARG